MNNNCNDSYDIKSNPEDYFINVPYKKKIVLKFRYYNIIVWKWQDDVKYKIVFESYSVKWCRLPTYTVSVQSV